MATVTQIDSNTFELQEYSSKDENLVPQFNIETSLTQSSYIEFFTYDLNNNIVNSNINFQNYSVTDDSPSTGDGISQFNINPENDILSQGYGEGKYIAYYNFLNKKIGDPLSTLFISEISSDRTEIRLDSNILSNLDIVEQANSFINFREDQDYFVDFYLNLGDNNLLIANNIQLENETTDDPTILIKLYEPLPSIFNLKSTLWVVTIINESLAFQVDFPVEPVVFIDYEPLEGPNFAIPVKNEVNNSSQNLSYNDIISGASTNSTNQIDSLLSQSSVNISVDYNNFSDFIHFSSAQTRIENFYYKVELIETYTSESISLSNVTGSSTSQLIFDKKIKNVIANFDKFEYFMYYSSGSANSYPKTTSKPPYTLYSTKSPEVLTWLGSTNENSGNFGGLLISASNYDNSNPDQLLKTIPEYLREDPANQQYDLFVDMVAQYYDSVWLYTKDITQKYNADNRLDFGVSKDLVSDAIKDFGVKLYQNNFSNSELYTAFLGLTPEGSTFPFPEITGSMPVPTGFEFVDTLISASNDVISMDDTNKSLYKRIYHNIPYLLKSKGTITGLRALITSYGIPDTILRISEFGGKDKVNANDYDLYFNNFNYAFNTTNNFISSSWEVNNNWDATSDRPSTVQFRFKAEEFPPTNLSQSLWSADDFADPAVLVLDYSGSGLTSGSYDGSIKDPNYQVANLRFIPYSDNINESASISLPFYNGDWWSVMITTDQNGTYNLYAGNKIYNGNDGTSIGYYASASITGATDDYWKNSTRSLFAQQNTSPSFSSYKDFTGSLQEIRYYNTQISESVFKDYIMNPLSFEGNGINSAPDQLIFRAALGSELDIKTSTSIHPKITGSWTTTSSFANGSNFYFDESPQYSKNVETFFLDQPAVGIKNRITDKIRSESDTLPSGNVLSPIRSLSQTIEASASYTDNVNYLEVAFSPQNQINDDIIGQMGHFNIGDYIGDPSQRFSGNNYPDLNSLSEDYFKKYIKQYDLTDFVRLIKFFDNSLFKMIKDFIPARTSLASGIVIKQHLLERNKYKQPTVNSEEILETGSIDMVSINGGAAGVLNPYNVSYDLDYQSGSAPIQTNVSGSSTGNTFNNLDTSINGINGTFITNAATGSTKFPFFDNYVISSSKSYVPNLWVELHDNSGNLVANAFNSGSNGIPFYTNVSGSGELTMYASSDNQFTVSNISSNANAGLNFPPFINEGYIQTTEAIFDNGSGTPVASSSVSSIGATLTTTFPTASVITNVSASLTSVTNNFGGGFINRYDIGGSTTNASTGLDFTLFEGGYVSSSVAQFRDPVTGNATDKSPIQIIGSGGSNALRTVYLTSSIFTNVTAIATGVNATSGNTFNTPTVTTGATTSSIFTSSPSYVSSSGDIFIDPSGSSTNVSASGVATFGNPSNPGGLNVSSFSTNATDLNFSGFDDGNAYISCSADGQGNYPFSDGSEFGSGIAPIISATNINMSVSITGRNLGYNPQGGSIPFAIMSGSAATNDTFISQSSATSSKSPITSINSNFSNLETEFVTSSLVENYNLSFTATPYSSGATPKRWGSSAVVTNIPGGLASNAVIQPSTRGFIKATQTGNPNVNKDVFEDGSGNPTHVSAISSLATGTDGIRPVFDINSTTMPADENFNFIIMTGSISDVNNAGTIFVTTIPNPNITNETFTIYKGEMSDTPPTTTFISASGRPLTETQMEIYSGSISLTPPTQTFPSASARVISNVNFNFHTGSVTQPGSTTFIQTTIPPEVHDRAYISSISSNTLNLDTHYSINPVGATATGFEFYNDEFGNTNFFISNSILDISKMDFYNLNPQYPLYPNVTQSYTITTPSLSGSVTRLHWSQDEFYNGELSGSVILVEDGELNPNCNQFKNPKYIGANYKLRMYDSSTSLESNFINPSNNPTPGHISIFTSIPPPPPPPSPPTVITNTPSGITSTGMTLNGNVTDQGSEEVTNKGFYFGTNSNYASNTKTQVGSGTGTYTLAKTGLTPNTTYYTTAYAVNSEGEGIGTTTSQVTNSPVTQNIPTSFKVYHALNGNVADIGYYNSATTDFKWLWNEGINNGSAVDISSSLGTGGYTRLLPINQFGDVIYDFDLNNISVVQAGGTNVTSEWNITKEGGSTIGNPDRIKFERNANAQPFTGISSTDNIYLNFDITSSNTGGGTTAIGDASFNIKPAIDSKFPFAVSGTTASLYNKIPEFNVSSNRYAFNSTLSGKTWAGNNDVYATTITVKTFFDGTPTTPTAVENSPQFRNGVGSDWNDGSSQSLDGIRFVTGGGNATVGGNGVTAWAVEDGTQNTTNNHFSIKISNAGFLEIGYDGTNVGGLTIFWVYFYVQDADGNAGSFTIPKTSTNPGYTPSENKIFAARVRVS